MAPLMPNIPILLKDLRSSGWHITSFIFQYKTEYIVLFEDLKNLKPENKEYLVRLTFIDRNNKSKQPVSTLANAYRFSIDAREFREFLGVKYTDGLWDIFKRFYSQFGKSVPTKCITNPSSDMADCMVSKLSQNDNDKNNCLCCYKAVHNPIVNGVQRYRSPFNSDKTRLLRPALYDLLGTDPIISFYYREKDPLSDAEIVANLDAAKQKRH